MAETKVCESYIILNPAFPIDGIDVMNPKSFFCERGTATHFECYTTTPVGRIYWPSNAPLKLALDKPIESGILDTSPQDE